EKQGDDYPARLYIHFDYDPAKLSFLERTKLNAASAYYGRELPTGSSRGIGQAREMSFGRQESISILAFVFLRSHNDVTKL
ncbi:MAG: DUF3047 domain-containing protein, partial [Gammaproteobacteria bacterium]